MTEIPDPFVDLYEPVEPIAPAPDFARRLRSDLERALARPRGVVPVTATVSETSESTTAEPPPAAVPYLAVADARAAVDWYVDVFGAELGGDPIVMPDGAIGHAELLVSGGVIYLAEQAPDLGVVAPRPGEASVSLMLPVDDADRVRGRAIDRGADGERPPYDGYGRRYAWIVDPFGHRWGLNSPLRSNAPVAYRRGDVVHVSHVFPDVERARAFYAAVLGWRYRSDGRVDGSAPSIGFRSGDTARLLADYAVTDLDRALAAVFDAGGTPGDVERYEWGTVAECVDDQGVPFRLHEVPDAEDAAGPPPVNGNGPGDLGYLTLHVTDSAAARAFYGRVLGWTFTPGRIADGWGVDGVAPMTGLAGGHEHATGVAQWYADDIHAAVRTVRARGGSATDPEQQPYGWLAECVDDQGLPFYLGQA